MKSHFLVCWHTLTDRHTDRHTYRQTDTQIDIHIDRQTHRHTETQTHIQTDRHTDRQTDTRTNTQRDTETDTHTHRETDTQTADWQTDRHTDRTVLWRLVTILTARYFIITCRPVRSAAMPVLFLLSGPKMGFSPRRGDRLPRQTWNLVRGCLLHAKLHIYRGRNVGIQPAKLSKLRILAINLPLRGHSFAQFLRNFQILYASPGGF